MLRFEGPSGKVLETEEPRTSGELITSWKLGKGVVAARVNGVLVDLSTPLTEGGTVEPVAGDCEEGLEILRHSAAHLMAQAIRRLFPEARFGIGPAVKDGFYYDVLPPRALTEEDLPVIQAEMDRIVQEDVRVERRVLPREEVIRLFRQRGEIFKLELLGEIPDEEISTYWQGDFVDLCRGPHVPSTSLLRHVKLLSLAGAYWR